MLDCYRLWVAFVYYAPTKKGKKGKSAKSTEADGSKKPIKHNAETFKLFDSLKLDPPLTVAQGLKSHKNSMITLGCLS